MPRKKIHITGSDAEALKALGIDPSTVEEENPTATVSQDAKKRPSPTEDDPRGLARLQKVMREWRLYSQIYASDKEWSIQVKPGVAFAPVRVDTGRTPRQGDVILVSTEGGPGKAREYDFALVDRVVLTGGINVRLCVDWHRGPQFTRRSKITSREMAFDAWKRVSVEGVVTNTEVLRSPAHGGKEAAILDALIMEQRAKAKVPRFSGRQGCRDDRIKQDFILTLDCEAMPRVGDVIVTRWIYPDGLEEQVDAVKAITPAGGLELEGYYGGDLSFVSYVEPSMIQRQRRPHVLIEGVVRSCERGELPTA